MPGTGKVASREGHEPRAAEGAGDFLRLRYGDSAGCAFCGRRPPPPAEPAPLSLRAAHPELPLVPQASQVYAIASSRCRRQGLIGFTFLSTPFTRMVMFPWFRARSATIL